MKPAYKQTEVGVIPEDWDVRLFTQVTDLITCGIAATPDYVSESQGYPFLSSTNVKDGQIVWSGYKHISADLHRQLYRNNPPNRGDLLYSRVGTIGEAAVIDVDFEFSVYVSLTLIKAGRALDPFFLMHLLNSIPYKRRAKEQVYLGGGVGNLNVDVVRKYPIPLPPLPEQRAIATALSDVDGLLGALERLIAKKRDLKQAAMQQLLTGQTRLPGYHGEWVTKTFGEVLTRLNAKAHQIQTSDYQASASYPVVDQGKNDVAGFSDREDKLLRCPEGGVIVFGDHTCIIKFIDFDFLVGADGTQILQGKTGQCTLFHAQALQHRGIEQTGYNRHFKFLKERCFVVPPLSEQTAIASVLSDMDAELAALEERREKTRALKQGMMQELLTGRIRLV
jgi:type I restriction enzyme S subunit